MGMQCSHFFFLFLQSCGVFEPFLLHHDVLVFCSLIFPPFEYTEEERTLIAMRSDSAKISILIHLSDAPEDNNK
jgi:hypothetical protein